MSGMLVCRAVEFLKIFEGGKVGERARCRFGPVFMHKGEKSSCLVEWVRVVVECAGRLRGYGRVTEGVV